MLGVLTSILLLAFPLLVESSQNLLVAKNFNSQYAVQDVQYSIHYTLFNLGDQDVTNVQLDDRESFPTNKFEIHSGSLKVQIHRIPAKSNVSHAVVVTPRIPGETQDQQAIVSYHDAQRNEVVTAKSSSHGVYMVYNYNSYSRVFSSKFEHFAIFAAICGPLTLLSFFFYTKSAGRYNVINSKKVEAKRS